MEIIVFSFLFLIDRLLSYKFIFLAELKNMFKPMIYHRKLNYLLEDKKIKTILLFNFLFEK